MKTHLAIERPTVLLYGKLDTRAPGGWRTYDERSVPRGSVFKLRGKHRGRYVVDTGKWGLALVQSGGRPVSRTDMVQLYLEDSQTWPVPRAGNPQPMEARQPNPAWRYLAVPVQKPGSTKQGAVVRIKTKRKGLSDIAYQVPDDTDFFLDEARTFDTKGQARTYIESLGYTPVEYARRKTPATTPTTTARSSNPMAKKMTKRQFEEHFEAEVLPFVARRYEQDGVPDKPARREAWNDTVDAYIRDGRLPESAGNWTHPRWLETRVCEVEDRFGNPGRQTNGFESDEAVATELVLYADNTYDLHMGPRVAIIMNLLKKVNAGTYDSKLAAKSFENYAKRAADKYAKEFPGSKFTAAQRRLAAQEFRDAFEAQLEAGEWEHLRHQVMTKKQRQQMLRGMNPTMPVLSQPTTSVGLKAKLLH